MVKTDVEANDLDDDGGADKGYRRGQGWKRMNHRSWNIVLTVAASLLFVRHQYKTDRVIRLRKDRASKLSDLTKLVWSRKKARELGINTRVIDPRHLPNIPTRVNDMNRPFESLHAALNKGGKNMNHQKKDFKVRYSNTTLDWEKVAESDATRGTFVDYTKLKIKHPKVMMGPPAELGLYPPLEPMGNIFERWPQDEIDDPPSPIVETLMHFDYLDPVQVEASIRFRDAELPFKVYNVPELQEANLKWTDEYVAGNFDADYKYQGMPKASGNCQESNDNFFAYFRHKNWNVDTMGPAPTLDNNFSFGTWARHARYADKMGIPPNHKHYYWQSGVPPKEREKPKEEWSFISLDLPTFSSPTNTYFQFHAEFQQGIQCRFGERGVVAATHYDSGKNMIGMITGAKRYVLSPPSVCGNLGLITETNHPSFRHSMLNFGKMNLLKDPVVVEKMSAEELEWLQLAARAPSIDTVLRSGEVLYIPTGWFHYIISLQKSAQCNVRSGVDKVGSPVFGSIKELKHCIYTEI